MEKNKQYTTPPLPSTEEKVQRIIRAGEKAREEAEHNEPDTPDAVSSRLEQVADTLDTRAEGEPEPIQRTAHHIADKARGVAHELRSQNHSDMKEKVQTKIGEVQAKAGEVQAKAQETVDEVRARANEVSTQATLKSDEAMTSAGQQMENVASTMRSKAPSGKAGDVTMQAADALERGGRYLQQSGPDDVRIDLETIIRKRPMESLLVGAGIGFLLARTFRGR